MIRDLKSRVSPAQTLAPASRVATANGAGVDLRGFDSAVVLFEIGAVSGALQTLSVEHSDDNAVWSAVPADQLQGALAAVTANSVQQVGYVGGKRYVRGSVNGATTAILSSAAVIRGRAHRLPAA